MSYRNNCIEKWQKKLDKADKLRREYGDKWWQSWNKEILIYKEIINDLNKLITDKNENED